MCIRPYLGHLIGLMHKAAFELANSSCVCTVAHSANSDQIWQIFKLVLNFGRVSQVFGKKIEPTLAK